MKKKVYIETLGCQMNKSDSEKILGIMENIGYQVTEISIEADLLMVNTCNIRAMSENKAFSHIGMWKKWKKTRPDLKIAICGCIAQQGKEKIFKRAPYIDLIFGTQNINELPELIAQLEDNKKVCSIRNTPYELKDEDYFIKRQEGISAWLPIIEGCDYFCTYCVVPYTRGRQRSRKPEDIIKEAKTIADQGYKEITLLGQTVDSYGKDFDDKNINFANLLRQLNDIENIVRIRFMTSHPLDIDDNLIETIRELDKVCEYFHIPMQSGNNEILEKMRRKYTREEYIDLINKIRSKMPDVGITSDFIAGFPGETQEQFDDTVNAIQKMSFDYYNAAAYSPRKQTPAAVWKDQVPEEIKRERLSILNAMVKEACISSNQKHLGQVLEVLVENFQEQNDEVILSGRARNNKIVHFPGDKKIIGHLVNVEIQNALTWYLKGEIK